MKVNLIIIVTLLKLSITQDCGMNPPNSVDDCFTRSYDDGHCCYLSNSQTKLCKFINVGSYNQGQRTYYLNNTQYDMICTGIPNNNNTGGICGIPNPQSRNNCTDDSYRSNKCCYYQKGEYSTCFRLGEAYTSQIIELFSTTNGVVVTCSSESYYLFYTLIFIPLLIIL
jgi:hypothetical protein